MEYSYWISGVVSFIALVFVIFSIIGIIMGKSIFYFTISVFTPVLFLGISTIFTAKKQKLKNKIDKMDIKEKRTYKLKKIFKEMK